MRTIKLIGLAALSLSAMTVSAKDCSTPPPKKDHGGHHSCDRTPLWGLGFSLAAPAPDPVPYIPPPPSPSSLVINGTVYNIDGGGGAVLPNDPPSAPVDTPSDTSILDELDLDRRRAPLNPHQPKGTPRISENQFGTMVRSWPDGTSEVTHKDGSQTVTFPDGSTFQRNADGSMVDMSATGQRTTRDKDGNVTKVEQVRPPNEIGPEGAPRLDLDRVLNGGSSQPNNAQPKSAETSR